MTERVGFSQIEIHLFLDGFLKYLNKLASYSFDLVNSIIKAFLFLVEWKFARMKIHYSFHSVIINISFLESCLEVIYFLDVCM